MSRANTKWSCPSRTNSDAPTSRSTCWSSTTRFPSSCPTPFTPASDGIGDGINDGFKPIIRGINLIQKYKFQAFDRWGTVIFETYDYDEFWKGDVFRGREDTFDYFAQNEVYNWKTLTLPRRRGRTRLSWAATPSATGPGSSAATFRSSAEPFHRTDLQRMSLAGMPNVIWLVKNRGEIEGIVLQMPSAMSQPIPTPEHRQENDPGRQEKTVVRSIARSTPLDLRHLHFHKLNHEAPTLPKQKGTVILDLEDGVSAAERPHRRLAIHDALFHPCRPERTC